MNKKTLFNDVLKVHCSKSFQHSNERNLFCHQVSTVLNIKIII